MNREGKSYRAQRVKKTGKVYGSIVVVTRSTKWSPALEDNQSCYTHHCLVLECPLNPTVVGCEVQLDERIYILGGKFVSTWERDDKYVEI